MTKKPKVILFDEAIKGKNSFTKPSVQKKSFLEQLEEEVDGLPSLVNETESESKQNISGSNNIQLNNNVQNQQSISGNNNIQISGHSENITIQTPKAKIAPTPLPLNSIGNNPAYRQRIEGLLSQINEFRSQYHGKKQNYSVIYGQLASAFGFKKAEWKKIWLLDESRADEIILWLNHKLANTQQGRLNKAVQKGSYQHTRGHLFKQEKNYLAQLGWDDNQAKSKRFIVTGQTSRKNLTDNKFSSWVAYLERLLDNYYEE